ncbi:Z1 domain-containing protein [Corynebacterium cystitidis]|uniref:Z1 domain-containing protein n=1 Tax=Corynebacterium cystitidis TaxID=35757 RepID=UPI00211DD428|nr:Z1 domain-containing protein [Corynebacterium cystitidis]
MFNHYDMYLSQYGEGSYRDAINQTSERFEREVIESFDFVSYRQCLMYGDVQSGKTSHVLGVVGKAIENGFEQILFLTSDNTRLVSQTFDRILTAFPAAQVCGPDDERRFRVTAKASVDFLERNQPNIVVLNKNVSVLKRWKEILSTTDALHGKPMLIVDDEADAGSLNAKVNEGGITPVNEKLTEIRNLSPACIYLQVTGTPQSILLQAAIDEWRPDYYLSFSPGKGYIGGAQLFDRLPNPFVRAVGSTESAESLEFTHAVRTFIVTAAYLLAKGELACNMLVHPSRRKEDHVQAEADVKREIDFMLSNFDTDEVRKSVSQIWDDLKKTSDAELSDEEIAVRVLEFLERHEVSFTIVNSDNAAIAEDGLKAGCNVVVGGDSLGRGLTIPALQTVFYSRETKTPQADTLWQHARMFGYDRRLEFMRIFMPAGIAKNFHEVHRGNEAIKNQLDKGVTLDAINVQLDDSIKPTRSSVLNREFIRPIVGGVNYFAENPVVPNMDQLDELLRGFEAAGENFIWVSSQTLVSILSHFETDPDDFPIENYTSALLTLLKKNPGHQSSLVIRTGRKVSQATGSLLSPKDRALSDSINATAVLVLYRIEGNLGWASNPIWVPNIKLPEGNVYYRIQE